TTTTPTTTTPTGTPTANPGLDKANAKLPAIAGKRYEVTNDGFPRLAGSGAGAPKNDAAGADTVYRAGNALVEAPRGVLRGIGADAQAKLLSNMTGLYDAARAQSQSSPV